MSVLAAVKGALGLVPGWLYAIALVVFGALWAGQSWRLHSLQGTVATERVQYANERATAAQAAQTAEAAAREIESRREADKEQVIADARQQALAAQAAARTADAAAASLRKQVAAYVAAVRGAPANPSPAGGSPGQPSPDPLDLLAQLYGGSDEAAGEIAKYAGGLYRAASACERSYDGLQPR